MQETLRDIVRRLSHLPTEDEQGEAIDHTIYAEKRDGVWTADSPAAAVTFTISGDDETPAPSGMDYFLEVSVADEVIEAYRRHAGTNAPTDDEVLRAVLYYAAHDAFLPAAPDEPA